MMYLWCCQREKWGSLFPDLCLSREKVLILMTSQLQCISTNHNRICIIMWPNPKKCTWFPPYKWKSVLFWNICGDYLLLFNLFPGHVDIINTRMDSEDDDAIYDDEHEDSYNESGSDQGDESDFDIDCDEPSTPKRPHINDDFHYECLTPEALVSYMNDIIDEVNNVFQVRFLGFMEVRQTSLISQCKHQQWKFCASCSDLLVKDYEI